MKVKFCLETHLECINKPCGLYLASNEKRAYFTSEQPPKFKLWSWQRVCDTILSDYYDQEQGVPQGGVLSTTLFSIKINDIVNCLGNLTDCSFYVDDFCICYRSKSMATIERQLQQNLNKIENWATSNGFKFSKSKTQCVHFCQLRKHHDDPVLHLYGSPIPVVEESKFHGILFDRKLSFIPHIKYLKAKCLKALNL